MSRKQQEIIAQRFKHRSLQAAEFPKGSIQRLLKVVAYALSPYSTCHADRIGKPLFVIPGETLEAVYPKKGVRYIGEAVSQSARQYLANQMLVMLATAAAERQNNSEFLSSILKVGDYMA